ncbi:uncharacterized protein Ecym_2267 [Eremothecium cymbalariae DBVPG|uniref:Protein RMD9, mitochondrial n=1 Tax=Eremothecium cymbalariae (strain CBS 270.75 / DBVPG 7215 / KCTC 17166 / NRRL Y-17582) TaxID=931890 RepID=G8JPQ8_ERECY|nr:Hypothetical protein Ecym_2267 [Eremothecium cymbalariae DBVPG\
MFRFVQQTQVLKGRVPNQIVSASRNSFHPQNSLRFNSAVTLDKSASQEPQSSGSYGSGSGTSPQLQQTVKKVRSLRKNVKLNSNNNGKFRTSPESPWFHKVCAFDEYVNQSMETSLRHRSDGLPPVQSTLFWDSIGKAMSLYRELTLSPELKPYRVSKLVNLLHLGLKVNRSQLTSMNKKPDYDSQSFHKEMTNYLCDSLREISGDILAQRVAVSEFGALHLLESFKELLLHEETVSTWQSAVNSADHNIVELFMKPSVVGVVLPLLYENGTSYEEIQILYEKSAATNKKQAYLDPGLTLGMIKASLAAGETEKALKLFQDICETNSNGISRTVITGTHLAFIGECKDLSVAKTFFERALADGLPYKMNLQVSSVKLLLQNIWGQTRDFQQVSEIWERASRYYGRNVSHGISSSLNSKFFSIFFEHFLLDRVNGASRLRELIAAYNNIKPIDEPFFNIILTKCTVWGDRDIIEAIENSYDIYHIPKTIVTYRILLKAMGSIDVSNEEIHKKWIQLVTKADAIGQNYIANADWAALRDATVAYVHNQTNSVSREHGVLLKSTYEDYNPALEAANASGAFDLDINSQRPPNNLSEQHQQSLKKVDDRIELYYKIVKRYSPYCRDNKQYTRISSGVAANFPVAQPYVSKLAGMDVSDTYIPSFKNFRHNL